MFENKTDPRNSVSCSRARARDLSSIFWRHPSPQGIPVARAVHAEVDAQPKSFTCLAQNSPFGPTACWRQPPPAFCSCRSARFSNPLFGCGAFRVARWEMEPVSFESAQCSLRIMSAYAASPVPALPEPAAASMREQNSPKHGSHHTLEPVVGFGCIRF